MNQLFKQLDRQSQKWWLVVVNLLLISIVTFTGVSPAAAARSGGAAVGSFASIQTPPQNFGFHRESFEDMRVKVMGGFVRMTRSWDSGKWYFNRRWESLKEVQCTGATGPADGGPCAVTRSTSQYNWISGNTYQHYENPRETILKTATGYRWQDRDGNWIEYDNERKATSYGDRNNVKVTLLYDATNKLTGVADHFNKQVLWFEYNASNQLVAVRDYTNRRVEYQYTTDGLLSITTDVRGNLWKYGYTNKRLTTKTDPEGRVTTINYGANGVVSSILNNDGNGEFYKSEYDKTKKEFYRQERTSGGLVKETWFDSEGDIIREDIAGSTFLKIIKDGRNRIHIDAAGNRTIKEYDEWENLTKETYADGTSRSWKYDVKYSNVLEEVSENKVVTKYSYDKEGNLVNIIYGFNTPNQRTITYSYDLYGNRLSQVYVGDAKSGEAKYQATYDNYGNKLTVTDAENNTEEFTYDVQGNFLTNKDAKGNVWVLAYDAAGNLLSESDPLGNTSNYTYDKVGNRISEVDAKQRKNEFSYNARNAIVSVVDPLGKIETNTYDVDGRLVKQTDRSGRAQQFSYDKYGRKAAITIADNIVSINYQPVGTIGAGYVSEIQFPTHIRKITYDRRNRIVKQEDVLSANDISIVKYEYDAIGNRTKVIDEKNQLTQYVYDELNRLIDVINVQGNTASYEYDNRDNILSIIDFNGNKISYEYDLNDKVVSEQRPTGKKRSYTYDLLGGIQTITDAKGVKVEFIYDAAVRNTAINYYPDVSATTPQKIVGLSYDELSNLTGYDDGVTSGAYQYDELNRLSNSTVNYGTFSKTQSYQYYDNDFKKSFTTPDGVQLSYDYDNQNRLKSIKIPGKGSVVVNEYNWNAPSLVTYPGGSKTRINYDSLERVIGINSTDPAGTSSLNRSLVIDKLGNVTEIKRKNKTTKFTYDKLNRLTIVEESGTDIEKYTYDNVGNRLSDSLIPGEWKYDVDNQLLSIGSNISYNYDANGSRTQRVVSGITTEYIYDVDSRLSEVKQDGTTLATYYYDPFGRRLWKNVSGVKTYYLYSQEGLLAEYDDSGNEIRQYGYIPNTPWGTKPVYLKANGQYYYFQIDHLGTPQQLISASGAVVWSAQYSTFGYARVDSSSTIENPLRFPGQYYDEETGLHYNLQRYYDPSIGRYLSADPLGYLASLNIFEYANNNPITYVDPEGEWWQVFWLLIKAADVVACIKDCLDGPIGQTCKIAGLNGVEVCSLYCFIKIPGAKYFKKFWKWIAKKFKRPGPPPPPPALPPPPNYPRLPPPPDRPRLPPPPDYPRLPPPPK